MLKRLLPLLILLVAACAKTSMTSSRSPYLQDRPMRSIVVYFVSDDLQYRTAFENAVVSEARGMTTQFVPSHTILFPGRGYTAKQVQAELAARNIEALLMVAPGGAGTTTAQLPTQATTGCTMWVGGTCTQAQTTVTGGQTVHRPYAGFAAYLLDTKTETSLWVASATSGGNAFANWGTLLNSLAGKTVGQLKRDGLVR